MHVFTFRSETHPGMTGFTTRRTGDNLPQEFGPWLPVSQGAMHAGDPVTGVYRGADAVLAGIDRDGFYIARARTGEFEAGGLTGGLANPRAK
jgi:hypothetical protein